MKRNEILQKKHTDIMHLKQWPNTSKMVNAFTNVDFCHGEDDVSIYGSDFSPIDSGISSRPVSRANTNETSSECTEESGMIHTSLRHRVRKKWCDKSDYEQTKLRSGTCHVSRGLTRMRHDFSATSSCLPIHRSIRQDLSITRHVARVRNAYSKRAKSAVAVVRFRKPESEIESYANNSTFYEDFKWFY
ncbi:unnamed protein product [Acanthocheilonema viteae]|uniref:Uncharacterized protein n=1 Tax=Acanthocheilonema viteae TaxID=6277 RepID=A0A498SHM3_ACAVI|nr:unnamed protein product [Acanthocheilonema viteae]